MASYWNEDERCVKSVAPWRRRFVELPFDLGAELKSFHLENEYNGDDYDSHNNIVDDVCYDGQEFDDTICNIDDPFYCAHKSPSQQTYSIAEDDDTYCESDAESTSDKSEPIDYDSMKSKFMYT